MVLRNHPPTHNPLLPDPPSYCPAQSPPLTPSRFRTPFSPTISTHWDPIAGPPLLPPYPSRSQIPPSPTISPPTQIPYLILRTTISLHLDSKPHPPLVSPHQLRVQISPYPTISSPTQFLYLVLLLILHKISIIFSPAPLPYTLPYILVSPRFRARVRSANLGLCPCAPVPVAPALRCCYISAVSHTVGLFHIDWRCCRGNHFVFIVHGQTLDQRPRIDTHSTSWERLHGAYRGASGVTNDNASNPNTTIRGQMNKEAQ